MILGTNTDVHVVAGHSPAPARFCHVEFCPRTGAPRPKPRGRGPAGVTAELVSQC